MSPESLGDGTSDQNGGAGSEEESDEDEAESADTPGATAPSSNLNSGLEQTQVGEIARMGQPEENQENDGDFYDSDSDLAEQEDENFDINDDDDDYDGVDKMSITSDGSDRFEEEVENEILAAGEDGIDWDDERTYGYAVAANSEYFVPVPHLDDSIDYMGFSYDDFEFDTDAATPNATFVTQEATPVFAPKQLSPRLSWSTSDTSDSARSEASDPASRRASLETGETGLTQLTLKSTRYLLATSSLFVANNAPRWP